MLRHIASAAGIALVTSTLVACGGIGMGVDHDKLEYKTPGHVDGQLISDIATWMSKGSL